MIDRSKAFWAWVYTNNELTSKIKRFVVEVNSDDSCLTVAKGHEDNFFSGKLWQASGWQHYKRIHEPKKC